MFLTDVQHLKSVYLPRITNRRLTQEPLTRIIQYPRMNITIAGLRQEMVTQPMLQTGHRMEALLIREMYLVTRLVHLLRPQQE